MQKPFSYSGCLFVMRYIKGLQGYGLSILRISYLVPRMCVFVLCLAVQQFFESRDA